MEEQQLAPEQVNALVINDLKPSKTSCETIANHIATVVKDGRVNAIDALIRLNAIAQTVELAQQAIKLDVLFELEKHRGETVIGGTTVKVQEAGVKYDYSANQAWIDLDKQIKALTEQRKAIEEVVKKIPAGKVIVDEATGETWQGANKTSTTTAVVRLAK